MLIRAARFLLFQLLKQPTQTWAAIITLSVSGILAGAGSSALIERRHRRIQDIRAGTPALKGIVPPFITPLLCLTDWGLLLALPRLRLSFSTEIGLPLFASILIRLFTLWGLMAARLLALRSARRRTAKRPPCSATLLFLAVNLTLSAVQVDAYILEPLLVETTELSLAFHSLDANAPPVRVVHITDTHIERNSYREAKIIRKVNALKPDIVVLTGDYLNLSRLHDPTSAAHFREFISQLQAPYGIYAVRGSVEPTLESMARVTQETNIVWLEQRTTTVDVRGQEVTLVGVACSHQRDLDAARLNQALASAPADAFTLLLYHSPDLILEAAERQIDLYLGGHTHGGQLCLPILGPIVTGSIYGRQYASGLSEKGGTRMYISRGLGFEGGSMPRARFLCRPELVSIDLGGK